MNINVETSSACSADERAKFEKKLDLMGYTEANLARDEHGNYNKEVLNFYWHIWQGALASQAILPQVVQAPIDLADIIRKKNAEIGALGIPMWTYATQDSRDARRYRRLQVLGAAPFGCDGLEHGTVLRFTNLDAFVDADITAHPSRGEAAPIVAIGDLSTTVPSEPVLYQRRMRPAWRDEGTGWSGWEDCSKESVEDILRLPAISEDWQYETRKLYAAAIRTATEQASDYDSHISDSDVQEWLERHNIENVFSITDARGAIGDARSMHMLKSFPAAEGYSPSANGNAQDEVAQPINQKQYSGWDDDDDTSNLMGG